MVLPVHGSVSATRKNDASFLLLEIGTVKLWLNFAKSFTDSECPCTAVLIPVAKHDDPSMIWARLPVNIELPSSLRPQLKEAFEIQIPVLLLAPKATTAVGGRIELTRPDFSEFSGHKKQNHKKRTDDSAPQAVF